MNAQLPLLYLREEPAWSPRAFERQKFPSAHDDNPELQRLAGEINRLVTLINPRGRTLRHGKDGHYPAPADGDIVGYYDETARRPMFRKHWWELTPRKRRELRNKTFIWTSYWEGSNARRWLVWLPRLEPK